MDEQQQEQQPVVMDEPPPPPVHLRRLEPPKPDTLQGCPEGEVRGVVFYPSPLLAPGPHLAWRKAPLLGQVSLPVLDPGEKLNKLVADMAATMYSVGGIGLSAVQVGVPLRVFIADVYANQPVGARGGQSQLLVAVNPVVAFTMGSLTREREGCVSFPGVNEHITRSGFVGLRGYDRHGTPFALRAGGALGRIIQHEMDHLDGVTFLEHMSPLTRRLTKKKMAKFHRGVQAGTLRVAPREKEVELKDLF